MSPKSGRRGRMGWVIIVAALCAAAFPTAVEAESHIVLYFSSTTAGSVDGVAFADEDIVAYDLETGQWSLFFDGSDTGLVGAADVDAAHVESANSILLSFAAPRILPGGLSVDDSDIVRFVGQLGPNTSGVFEVVLDGSTVGLTAGAEDIDAIAVDGDDLIVSTLGSATVPGPNGPIGARDEDLLRLIGDTWFVGFDGSDVQLTSTGEDVGGAAWLVQPDEVLLTTYGSYSVPGATGDLDDVVRFIGSLGETTSGGFELFFDGDVSGFGRERIDAVSVSAGLEPPPNMAPTIVSPSSVTVDEHQSHAIDVEALDDNDSEANGLSFLVTGGPDSAVLEMTSDTGIVTFIEEPDFETPTDADQDNIYEIVVTVTDSEGLQTSQQILIAIADIVEPEPNTAPAIVTIGGFSWPEHQLSSFDIQSTDDYDAEGSGLVYSFGGGPDDSHFTVDSGLGIVTFTNEPDFESPQDSGADNLYEITIVVADSEGLSDQRDFTVAVTDIDETLPPSVTDDLSYASTGTVLNVGPGLTEIGSFGSFGTGLSQFRWPFGIEIDSNGDAVIVDIVNHRIQTCVIATGSCSAFGEKGSALGQFDLPHDLEIDVFGNLVIADTENHRVQTCSPGGTSCTEFGAFGTAAGEFDLPEGIAIQQDGTIIVAETGNDRVQVCSAEGVCVDFGQSGVGPGEFMDPHGIEIGSDGTVFIADQLNHRIQNCEAIPGTCSSLGSEGTGDGEFRLPYDLVTDRNGELLITDRLNNRIQRCNPDGGVCQDLTAPGAVDGPLGIALDGAGNVLVTEHGATDRVAVFARGGVLFNDEVGLHVVAFDPVSTAGAAVSVASDGSYTYDPTSVFAHLLAGEVSTDTFTYTAANRFGVTSTATVTVVVGSPVLPPDAVDDVAAPDSIPGDPFHAAVDTPLVASVTANDNTGSPEAAITGFGAGNLGGTAADNPAGSTVTFGEAGQLTLNMDGSLTFIPDTDFTGPFNFEYLLGNTIGTDTATVSLFVGDRPQDTSAYEIYLSSTSGGTVGGITFADEDILRFNTTSGTWELILDGSDLGLNDIDALAITPSGDFLFSLTGPTNLIGPGQVDDSDLIRFEPTSLGGTTAGVMSLWLDGSAVGLSTAAEDTDAVTHSLSGHITVSILGSGTVPGANNIRDEDLVTLNAGATSWDVLFDGSGSQVGGEDVVGASLDPSSGNLFLTLSNAFGVAGVTGSGDDIVEFDVVSNSYTHFWDGDDHGFGSENVDALHVKSIN